MKKSNSKVSINTIRDYSQIVKSADIKVSLEDARALYDVSTLEHKDSHTDVVKISSQQLARYEVMRKYLRTIAKEILITSGPTATYDELLSLEINDAVNA